jgi:hypothetical protein
VIVSPSDVAPVSFRHERLPVPVMRPATRTAGLVQLAAAGEGTGETAAPAASAAMMAPWEVAQERLAKATTAKAEAERAVKPAYELATQRSTEARQLAEALKASAGILADAEEHLEFENFGMVTVQTEDREAQVLGRIRMAEAGLKAAREAHEKLIVSERAASDEAFAAAAAARDARAAAEAADEELRLARKAVEPLAVFVSRKTGRVYVRQGFEPIAEEAVTIAEPDEPLGTHVFTAMDDTNGGAELKWSVVSLPTNGDTRGRGRREMENAGEALARIAIPADVRQLMAERVWPGASIIVSDFGLGETGKGTDFVILTK